MPRPCTTNVRGSHVFYQDPRTGRITALTRGRILPAGVTRLVAMPYALSSTPTLEEFLADDRPGAMVFVVDASGRLVLDHEGPAAPTSPNYPRTPADQLLGELRAHLPSARQAEVLRKLDYLRSRFDVLRGTLPPLSLQEREIYERTRISPKDELTDLVETLSEMSYRTSYELQPPLDLTDSDEDRIVRYTDSPVDELMHDVNCLLTARRYGLDLATVQDVFQNVTARMYEPDEVAARPTTTLREAPWCVYVSLSTYNDSFYEHYASQLDSVWPTKKEAEDRQRAIEIAASITEDGGQDEASFRVFAWPNGSEPLTASDDDVVPTKETVFEHTASYVVYQLKMHVEDYFPYLLLEPVALYASAADALSKADQIGTWDKASLSEVEKELLDALDAAPWRADESGDPYVTFRGHHLGSLGTAGAWITSRDFFENLDYGMSLSELAGKPRAAVIAMPIGPSVATASITK